MANFQWHLRMRFESAGSIMVDPRRQHPAADSRLQAPENPFREAVNMSKNKSLALGLYHSFVVSQHFFHFFFRGSRGSGRTNGKRDKDRLRHETSKTVPIWKTEQTAKYFARQPQPKTGWPQNGTKNTKKAKNPEVLGYCACFAIQRQSLGQDWG